MHQAAAGGVAALARRLLDGVWVAYTRLAAAMWGAAGLPFPLEVRGPPFPLPGRSNLQHAEPSRLCRQTKEMTCR